MASNTRRTARSTTSGEHLVALISSWLHLLRSWSLLKTRGDSFVIDIDVEDQEATSNGFQKDLVSSRGIHGGRI
jgi:hypothetical protein